MNKEQQPIPEINQSRYTALKAIILDSLFVVNRDFIDKDVCDAMIGSWNRALRRVPTASLAPALQAAIENSGAAQRMTCGMIYQAWRNLL